ncbi:amidohydrolase family-domain-containing protein [Vararia minispora EC-137]|uniref:Amidohydrolase family-domain-containing protein n=1 Tax=Vararia minispora EC-137 TaxID=1314806 RepID=A0ACB8QYR0_9AGAM|nr:amidohydrolase family-domain-containing protein [Vararia minispora EC-137]
MKAPSTYTKLERGDFPSKSRPPRHPLPLPYILAVCISVLCISTYVRRGQPLPQAYALCSRSGAAIYTVDPERPRAQCMVVNGTLIQDVGSLEDVHRRWDTAVAQRQAAQKRALPRPRLETRFIKSGSIVVPGMSDSHAHCLEYGASRLIPLESARRPVDAVAAVRNYILNDEDIQADPEKYVQGWGWDHTRWPDHNFPTAADLDSDPVVRSHRVALEAKDGHAIWVNSKVLEEISPLPDEVEGGLIALRFWRSQLILLLGVLLDNAQYLVPIPPPTQKDLEKQFSLVVDDALSHGLTSIHDAGFDPKSLEFYKRLADENKLPIRIYGMTYFDENAEYWGDKVKPIIGAANGRFTARSVKFFGDGALRTGGAALFEPYADNPDSRGFMRIDADVLTSNITRFLRDGWQTNIHAIGDRANSLVLDAFESALDGINVTSLRPRLEHAQIIRHEDMDRLAKLGVIASVQPTHAIDDMYYGEARLGPERVKLLYAFRDIIDHGARITLGSDAPVETVDPILSFFAAIGRVAPDGTSPHGPNGWFPEQRLSREEALKGVAAGMTLAPAYASFTDDVLGSIVPGKIADYTILSQDIMTVPLMEVLETEVYVTAMDGRPVYGSI